MTVQSLGCKLPPAGWWCSRAPGHEGPCAARPTSPAGCQERLYREEAASLRVELVRRISAPVPSAPDYRSAPLSEIADHLECLVSLLPVESPSRISGESLKP